MRKSFQVSYEAEIFRALTHEVGTPLAAKARRLLDAADYEALARLDVDPAAYCQPEHYLRDKQVVSLLKKHPELPVAGDIAHNSACDKFQAAETLCYWTNERLSPLHFDLSHYGEGVRQLVVAWRKEIRRVLRKAPERASIEGRFGPGSTLLNKGNLITIADKLDDHYTATRTCLKSFSSVWDETAWSRYAAAGLDHDGTDVVFTHGELGYTVPKDWSPRDFEVVNFNRFTTVPKTALTDRGICIEPSLNVFYQLGVGEILSKRLGRAYGWYKADIQQHHRWLARVGSLTGANATIDLSNASDSVSTGLVRLLLPPDWHDLLVSLRAAYTVRWDGKKQLLEKFSSMGNGFTFELETLLFYTLIKAIARLEGYRASECPGDCLSVFGDDIIVPRALGPVTVKALNFFGFEVNSEKTFLDGPFRESCGGDYFRGADVRPFYLKKGLKDPATLISAVNGLRRFLVRDHDVSRYPLRGTFRTWLLNKIPRSIRRCRGPEALGDLVIHDRPELWDTVMRNSIRYLRVWRPVANREIMLESHFRPGVVGAYALYRAGVSTRLKIENLIDTEQLRSAGLVPRIRGSYVSGYRFGRVPFS